MREKDHQSKPGINPTPLIIGALIIVAIGTIAMSWAFVESLHDNSKKMELYKVQPIYTVSPKLLYTEGATKVLDQYDTHNNHPEFKSLVQAGWVAYQKKKFKKAIDHFQNSIRRYKQDLGAKTPGYGDKVSMAKSEELTAKSYVKLRDFKSASSYIAKAIVLCPNEPSFYKVRAEIYTATGQPKLAAEDTERFSHTDSQSSFTHSVMQDMLESEKKKLARESQRPTK